VQYRLTARRRWEIGPVCLEKSLVTLWVAGGKAWQQNVELSASPPQTTLIWGEIETTRAEWQKVGVPSHPSFIGQQSNVSSEMGNAQCF
jgi:hypothetical protein